MMGMMMAMLMMVVMMMVKMVMVKMVMICIYLLGRRGDMNRKKRKNKEIRE